MFRVIALTLAAGMVAGCRPAVLTQQVYARRLAADAHLQFTKAAEAANRAVMAGTDSESESAAGEATQALRALDGDVEQLRPVLRSLDYQDELGFLDAFTTRLAEYRRLDEEILPLAVENTNLKAQRLSFGPSRDAADSFRASLEAAVQAAAPESACSAAALAAKAGAAVLQIEVLYAPHIAEADAAAMTRIEQQMAALDTATRDAVSRLQQQLGAAPAPQMAKAADALQRFEALNSEIVALSRRNSNVRSLALSLGEKRWVTAVADDQLRAMEEALSRHAFSATR